MRIVLNCVVLLFAVCLSSDLSAQIVKRDSIQNVNRHDFLSRGNQANEIQSGNYIVAATALNEDDSKSTIKEFRKLKYPEPGYGFSSIKSIWYIYYGPFEDLEEAKNKRDEYRKLRLCKNAYLLTVHASENNEKNRQTRHEFIVRSIGADELGLGDYVIVGAFKDETESRSVTEELKKLNLSNAGFGYLSQRKLWYTYLGKYLSIDSAKNELERHRQLIMFKDAWLLTVHQ